jgi:hypothetical protein
LQILIIDAQYQLLKLKKIIFKNMILLEKILGGQGCLFIDAAVTGRRFYALVVNDDCVLTTLTTAGGQNLLTQYGLSGKTLKAGALIPMFDGDPIAAVTPSSGSLIGYGQESAL